jgi:acylphosphatase
MALTGWVKNLGDGRVEMVCEGSEYKLSQFLEKVEDLFRDYIKGSEIEWDEATGEFSGFDIRD